MLGKAANQKKIADKQRGEMEGGVEGAKLENTNKLAACNCICPFWELKDA